MSTDKRRTGQQNRALHKYCELLAEALNDAGLDMKKTLKPGVAIPWTMENVKNHLWRPIQQALTDKKSTTEMDRLEPGQIYEVLNLHLGEKFGIHIPWPSEETKDEQNNQERRG